ncbi:hypothetical protein SAMN04487950_0529 [Halogranum rubrum]|uniref:Uncharacterized protein n=1 Tax=Halogranum rubrum TaxID=553466 RepID=A0A1I4BFF7_9EURY|nr:hypothetical protein [Halogranum rubrum]SFK67602.1 hypothetical protein SAMN04487950_0529 [Halogranum rubrum]
MNSSHRTLLLTICCIAVATVTSGPLVHAVDLTPTESEQLEPSGLASVDDEAGTLVASNISIPDTGYHLEKGVAGSGIYKVSFPPARLHIESVTNTVMLTFAIEIPELGYMTQGVSAVDADSPRNFTLGTPEGQIEASKLTNQSYPATATLSVRSNGETRTLATRNVTIVVEGGSQ